jgi:hypothetical protein
MHLIAPELARSPRALADPSLEVDHSVTVQQRLQRVELAFLDGALRQQDDVDAADLVSGREEHPVDEI